MSKIIITFIKIYQLGISVFTFPRCRFTPTCSEYTIEVLKKVKYLLKDQGMTIIGVKKVLNSDKSLKLDELPNNSINANYNIKNKLKKISDIIKQIKNLK